MLKKPKLKEVFPTGVSNKKRDAVYYSGPASSVREKARPSYYSGPQSKQILKEVTKKTK